MQCVERGQLNLNDDIAKVLPEWKDPQILTGFDGKDEAIFKPATKTITLRQVILLPVSLMLMQFTDMGW
jgi:CubicO group peptidase (beta-lactamase class C family)